jgi:hypothetical protein
MHALFQKHQASDTMSDMEKPTTKRIAFSAFFIVVGCLLLAFPWVAPLSIFKELSEVFSPDAVWVGLLVSALAGSAMIVGAIGNLFRHTWVGALCGVSLYFTVCVIRAVFFVHIQ